MKITKRRRVGHSHFMVNRTHHVVNRVHEEQPQRRKSFPDYILYSVKKLPFNGPH